MKTGKRAGTLRRLLVLVMGVLLASLMAAAPAFAQDGTGDDGGIPVVDGVVDGLVDATSDTPIGDATADVTADDGLIDTVVDTVVDAVTDAIPDGGTDSTTPTGPTGGNTVIQYSPYPVPVFGDYGKRFYGKYWDRGCGCDRYAAPTYVPQVVVATQVSSVPKGGVDTGDGSFP